MKLTRSTPSMSPIGLRSCEPPKLSHAVNAIAATPSAATMRALRTRDKPMSATNTSGQTRYHCSSTARLHTCRSSGGSPE